MFLINDKDNRVCSLENILEHFISYNIENK